MVNAGKGRFGERRLPHFGTSAGEFWIIAAKGDEGKIRKIEAYDVEDIQLHTVDFK